MLFNSHSDLAGRHAFLSPSKYHWVNYDEEKLARMYLANMASRKGTELHELAQRLISLGVPLPRTPKTLNMYVNDAIGFRMTPEQPLYYSDNAFGTTDAIVFRRNLLRIHDLKNGATPTSMNQLVVYTALFCLEYGFKPVDIGMELRIYQNDAVQVYEPSADDVTHVMSKIINFDQQINAIRMEALS